MMKRFVRNLVVSLAVVAGVCAFAVTDVQAKKEWEDIPDTNVQWNIVDGVLNVREGYNSHIGPSEIPDMQEGSLTEWHTVSAQITKIVITDGITQIGANAFRGLDKVTEVQIGKDVTRIGADAFRSCTKLGEIVIPDAVDFIDSRAFACCSGLTSVVFGEQVSNLGESCFGGCTSLKSIEFKAAWPPNFGGGVFNEYPYPGTGNFLPKEGVIKVSDGFNDEDVKSLKMLMEDHSNLTVVINDTPVSGKWTILRENPKKDEPKPVKLFVDVNYSSWMGPSIKYVASHGYMKGTSDTSFGPNEPCTREMMVQILYNINGAPAVSGNCSFKDAVPGKWYYNSLVWGQKEGVAKGASDVKFGVGDKVTRQELAQFIYNYAKHCGYDISKSGDISTFPDRGEVSGWAIEAIKWATGAKVMGGKGKNGVNYLDPKGNATRAEVAAMIMNLMENAAK